MYFAQRVLLYPGATKNTSRSVAPFGEWTDIATPDGETLAALYVRAERGKPTFLFFHGNGDNIVHYNDMADALGDAGFGFLAVSSRGYPGSTGTPSEAGLLMDGLAAFDWLAMKSPGPIVLLGRSLGTGVAVNTAAERNAVALVLVSPFDSISAVAGDKFPFLPVKWLIKDSFHSDDRIGRVTAPKLFLHGDRDGVIPLAHGQALYEVAPEPKSFIVEKGRGHNNIWTDSILAEIIDFTNSVVGAN